MAALSLGGNDSYVRSIRAIHQWRGGHLGDALTESHRAVDLAPANPWVISNIASHYSLSGRDAEALKYADLAVELATPRKTRRSCGCTPRRPCVQGATRRPPSSRSRRSMCPIQNRLVLQVIKLVYAALANPEQRASALAARERLYPPSASTKPSVADLTNVGPCLDSSFRYALLGTVDAAYSLATSAWIAGRPAQSMAADHHCTCGYRGCAPFRQDPRFQAFATRWDSWNWQQYGPPDDCDLNDGKLTCH